MNKKNVIPIIVLAAIAVPAYVLAHNPNYIGDATQIEDTQPTASKAYYGELHGSPAYYTIIADKGFELDANILSPDIINVQKNYSVEITNEADAVVANINNPPTQWKRWYEEFGGDWYWQGPEIKMKLPAGRYSAIVQNPGNSGKYVLAIGEDESFPPAQAFHTLSELYTIKTVFFGKPWYNIFGGSIGRYMLIGLIILLAIIGYIVYFTTKKLRRMKPSQKPASP